jgi:catechol 2,3-dioxygenase-like lactoylglutathione lyase family enzyme
MRVSGIDHVQIAAPPGCEAAARAFYGGLLGLAELPKPEPLASRGGCWFKAGALELHVGVEEPFSPARKAHPGFVVDDLEALRATLAGEAIAVRDDTDLPGVARFYAEDPFGNRLEFRQL